MSATPAATRRLQGSSRAPLDETVLGEGPGKGMRTRRSDLPGARAMVLDAPRRLVMSELALPEIKEDDALLRIEACGLCGTDHEEFTGALPLGAPFVPGHESVGVIEAIGTEAARRWGVSIGERVAVEVFQSCRVCAACEAGEYRRCERHGIGDMYGFIPVGKAPGLWGGYATHQYLSPDSMLLRVPADLDPVVATLFNPLGAGIRWGSTLPGTSEGDVVAVLGPGVRGLSALIGAREAGARFVMVTGFGPHDEPRLDTARRFGADMTVDTATQDPVSVLRRATGGLADVVVDVTAKAPAAFAQAVELARAGGTVVVAGTRGGPSEPGVAGTPGFRPDDLVYKELRVLGALGVDTASYETAIDLLCSGRYPFESLTRKVAALEEVGELLAAMSGESGAVPPMHAVVEP